MFIYSYKQLNSLQATQPNHESSTTHSTLVFASACLAYPRSLGLITNYRVFETAYFFLFFAMRKLQLLLDFLRSLSMRARVLANQIVGPSEARTIGAWHGRQWDSWLASDNAHAHACTYVSHCVSVCVCLFVCLAYPGQPLTAV